jgi:60S ribosomal protein uL30
MPEVFASCNMKQ